LIGQIGGGLELFHKELGGHLLSGEV
jgi:hypothetical protein